MLSICRVASSGMHHSRCKFRRGNVSSSRIAGFILDRASSAWDVYVSENFDNLGEKKRRWKGRVAESASQINFPLGKLGAIIPRAPSRFLESQYK